MTRKTGRHFFANPGPTNIPDSVLRAMDRPSLDFLDPEFIEVYDAAVAGLKRVLGTSGEVFLYTASGHGAQHAVRDVGGAGVRKKLPARCPAHVALIPTRWCPAACW